MGYKSGVSQLALAGLSGLVLAVGFVIEGSEIRVTSAFADNTTTPTNCPDPIEGCQREVYDGVCYMVCDRGGTSAPMPEPIPTATPAPTNTPTPTPTQTSGPGGTQNPQTPYEQKMKRLYDRCPNARIPSETERYY